MQRKLASTLLVIACVTLLSGIGFASACPSGTMQNYIGTGFSCTINDKTFSNWFYEGTANPPNFALPPGSVGVVPQTTMGSEGFRFSAPWDVSTLSGVLSMDSDIDYGITVNPGGALITDVSAAIGGFNVGGTGSLEVDETLCIGALFGANGSCSGTMRNLRVFSNSEGTVAFNEISFAGVTEVGVEKDILLDAGTNGDADLSLVLNNVSSGVTPEPGSILLFGSGALALAGVLRRKLKH